MDEQFKERLRKWRGSLLQKEAAQMLGVSERTYESWEQGACEPTSKPSIREIEAKMKETKK